MLPFLPSSFRLLVLRGHFPHRLPDGLPLSALFWCGNERPIPARQLFSVKIRSSSSRPSYRNRYTHFRNAYPDRYYIPYGAYLMFLVCAVTFLAFGGGQWLDEYLCDYLESERGKKKKESKIIKAECQSRKITNDNGEPLPTQTDSDVEPQSDSELSSISKKRVGFRDRKFIAYEDRIRAYSTPDKIFRYFATLKCTDEEEAVLMTPDDFVRAITPGLKQPDDLDLDAFKRYDPKTGMVHFRNQTSKLQLNIPKDSIFYCLCEKALISFTDFVFLLTVLSTPRRQFEIAFRMFDLNGDGELDAQEFELVRSVILDTTPMGKRHRDHATTGNTLKSGYNSALRQYFFGPNGDKKLSITKFLDFQTQLQEEIMHLEFERADPKDNKITEVQFARCLLTYAGFSENRKRKMLRGVKQKFSGEESEGISYRDFADFSQLLRSITDVDTALTFHHMAGAPIDQETLSHVALAVANIKLSPHLVDVVFTLFDENNDGHLSYREFVGVMKNRLLRGLDKPMDTGFIRFVNAAFRCGKEIFYHRSTTGAEEPF